MDLSWRPPVPAIVGDSVTDVQTPALLIDMANFEYNLNQMAKSMQKYPAVAVRPHAKAHKCPAVAKLQVCIYCCFRVICETIIEVPCIL